MDETGRKKKKKYEKFLEEIDLSWHIMMSNLVPLVLHELNNPLTAINAYSSLLSKTDDLEMIKKDIAVAIREGNINLTNISEACQSLYRLDSRIERIRFSDAFDPLHFFLSVKFRRYGVSLAVQTNGYGEYIHCPQRYLAVAIYALFINCLATAMALGDGRHSVIHVSNNFIKAENLFTWTVAITGDSLRSLPGKLPDSAFCLPEFVECEPEPFADFVLRALEPSASLLGISASWSAGDDGVMLRADFPLFR